MGILAGQYFDTETGLHYNYHRYFDPKTGRYLTPDPIGMNGGVNFYAYASNKPIMMIDPFGLEVRVYSSDAFGIPGFNHAFVYSTELKSGKGRAGSSGFQWGNGIGDLSAPHVVVNDLKGLSESEFMRRIEAYPRWNRGPWIPWIDDCHAELAEAFNYAGIPYPGALNDRIDIDDKIAAAAQRAWQALHSWYERLVGENGAKCK
jgi:RHS repeat-associated protein